MTTPFARKVKEIRTAARLNQAAFARRLGVDQSTVSKWERGRQKPDTEALMALTEFCGENLFNQFHAEASDVAQSKPAPQPIEAPAGPSIPVDLVRVALELVLRRTAGMSDSGAQELSALILEELQAPEQLASGSGIAALQGALDYIVRRSVRKPDA